jgi:hypothetical protein
MARDGFEQHPGDEDDPLVLRLLELRDASAEAKPPADLVRRVAARLDERHLRHQLAVALAAAALAASVSLAFWWDASARLAVATVATAFDDSEGLEP